MELILLSDYDHARHKGDPKRRWAPVEVSEADGKRLIAHGSAHLPEDYPVDAVTGELRPGKKVKSVETASVASAADSNETTATRTGKAK